MCFITIFKDINLVRLYTTKIVDATGGNLNKKTGNCARRSDDLDNGVMSVSKSVLQDLLKLSTMVYALRKLQMLNPVSMPIT